MVSSKFFPLSLLLINFLAFGRVKVQGTLEINPSLNPAIVETVKYNVDVELDAGESKVLCVADVELQLTSVSEQEENTTIACAISTKGAGDLRNQLCAPVLVIAYDKPATLTTGQRSEHSEQVDLALTLSATQV